MESSQQPATDRRHHVRSLLMRESLLDKQVMSSTETPVVRMLADCHVIKVGGRSIIDGGKVVRTYITSSGAPATPTVIGTFRVYLKTPGTNAASGAAR